MTNLEELEKLNDTLLEHATLLNKNAGLIDSNTISSSYLNLLLATYLPSIAKSLAIIADKMSEKDKED